MKNVKTLGDFKLTLLAAIAVVGMGLAAYTSPANAITWNDNGSGGTATCDDWDEAGMIVSQLGQDGAKITSCKMKRNGKVVVKYTYN